MDVEKLFSESPEFVTNRLYLRQLTLDDSEDYFEFASDPEVTTYTMWETHKTIDDSRKYLNYVIDKYKNRQAYHWGIVDISTNKLIGRTGLIQWDINHQRTEIGFALSRKYWNKGIITEATREIIKYSFKELNVNRIEGRCNYDNTGSARVMEKLGMVFEGVLREQLKIKGSFKDQKMYSILKSDYVSQFKEGSSFR
jgi:ribosomal-protein-alanine N-acetyltransferase